MGLEHRNGLVVRSGQPDRRVGVLDRRVAQVSFEGEDRRVGVPDRRQNGERRLDRMTALACSLLTGSFPFFEGGHIGAKSGPDVYRQSRQPISSRLSLVCTPNYTPDELTTMYITSSNLV